MSNVQCQLTTTNGHQHLNKTDNPTFLVVDCFCGAGGTTTGFRQAVIHGRNVAKVIACINHDPKAIKSHLYNHPEVTHFQEDIRKLDLTELIATVKKWQQCFPRSFLVLWASLECTNFSRAKAGKPKNADSRTLADHLCRYIEALQPHYVQIENVVEFMSWGPLDANGRPINKQGGRDWLRWRQQICRSYGYIDNWRELNSANFGAYTSRNRLFGIFAKPNLPVLFPEITHKKHHTPADLFNYHARWKSVSDILNIDNLGTSIFVRKKQLSDKTLTRIYEGLQRFVMSDASGTTIFLTHYYGKGFNTSINDPLPTITTKERAALVVVHYGECRYEIKSGNSDILKQIITLMHTNAISDISMRMLLADELLQAQGFPRNYQFEGSSVDKIKFIGNSVVPVIVKSWVETLALNIQTKLLTAV